MKNRLLILILFFVSIAAFSQNRKVDSLNKLLLEDPTDTIKSDILVRLALEYQLISPDTTFFLAQRAYKISNRANYFKGVSGSASVIGNVYSDAGNYAKALEYYIIKLKVDEKRKEPEALAVANMTIANVYHLEGNNEKAFTYAFCADSIIDDNKITRLKLYSILNLGDMFEKSGKISAALDYTEKAYALAIKEDNTNFIGASLNNLGNIYAKMGNTAFAIQHYSAAIPFLTATEDDGFVAEASLGLAKQYTLIGKLDSAEYYAEKSYELSKKNGFLSKQLDASAFLSSYYKNKNEFNKAFTYQEEVLVIKDSIFSKEKIAKSQLISLEEDLRQKEIAEKKIEEAEERKIKLQYLTIGILLPIFFFITVFLSNRKIKPKIIEYLGVVSLLLTFEYIMLLLHPLIVKITNHLPFYQLLIFAVIASVLTPLHHRIENWLLKVLTRKEKISLMKIRIQ
ncbi:MAG: tetratricopeptide repeat protein [Chitinophagales bacterium]|nr:tetratricopeptide repeat protein [Chitinophagales bacterium]